MNARGRGSVSVQLGVIRATQPERIRLAVQLQNPVTDKLAGYVAENRTLFDRPTVAQAGTGIGRSLSICGAGPSLRDSTLTTDDVWACNSALPYLFWKGARVTHGIGLDQTDGLLKEWESAPDVPYLIASSVDPALVRHLQSRNRSLTFFHNYVDVPGEIALYRQWPSTFMVTDGYAVVSRVIPLALWMGYDHIELHGADCEFGPDDLAHANGDSASDAYGRPMIYEHTYENGRVSRTRMDMLMDAVHLARLAKRDDRIRLIGDTLPAYLMTRIDAFLDDVCRVMAPEVQRSA